MIKVFIISLLLRSMNITNNLDIFKMKRAKK